MTPDQAVVDALAEAMREGVPWEVDPYETRDQAWARLVVRLLSERGYEIVQNDGMKLSIHHSTGGENV